VLSIIIPAYNEAHTIGETLQNLQTVMENIDIAYEIIVVDDGSEDNTVEILEQYPDITLIQHPDNGGYGRAIKTGMNSAQYDWCCICDADGTYPVTEIPNLLQYVPDFDMVIGERTGKHYWGSFSKRMGRIILSYLVAYVIGRSIPDINSGLRIFRKDIALKHIKRISSGFSFTTTITLAMALDEKFLKYVPIDYYPRTGTPSKVRIRLDSLRMLQILTMAIIFYNPLKLFLPLCFGSVFVGVFGMLVSFITGPSSGWLLFPLSILIAFIIGALGFVTEAIRLQRTLREAQFEEVSNTQPHDISRL